MRKTLAGGGLVALAAVAGQSSGHAQRAASQAATPVAGQPPAGPAARPAEAAHKRAGEIMDNSNSVALDDLRGSRSTR